MDSLPAQIGTGEKESARNIDDNDWSPFIGAVDREGNFQSGLAAVLVVATSEASTRLQPPTPQKHVDARGYQGFGIGTIPVNPRVPRRQPRSSRSSDVSLDFSFVSLDGGCGQASSERRQSAGTCPVSPALLLPTEVGPYSGEVQVGS